MCTHWQFAVDRHCVAMCAHRPCLADLHGSGARFHSQCKKEQHKCREATETQRNFVIELLILIVALGLQFRCFFFNDGIRHRNMHSVTVKALAGGHGFSPAVLVS